MSLKVWASLSDSDISNMKSLVKHGLQAVLRLGSNVLGKRGRNRFSRQMTRPAKVRKTSIFVFAGKLSIKQKQPCSKATGLRSPKNHSTTFSRFTWGQWVLMMPDGKPSFSSFKMTFFGLAATMQFQCTVPGIWLMRVQKIGGPISRGKLVCQPADVSLGCFTQTFHYVKPPLSLQNGRR